MLPGAVSQNEAALIISTVDQHLWRMVMAITHSGIPERAESSSTAANIAQNERRP